MSQVIQSGITSLESELHHICQLGMRALDHSKAAAGLYMLRSGHPCSTQGTDNILKKIWGKGLARVLNFFFFISVCFVFPQKRSSFFFVAQNFICARPLVQYLF